jgi:hypothetical protein
MYKVIKYFTDLQDNNHAYNVGDVFPHEGMEVTQERLDELAGHENRQKQPLIEFVEEIPAKDEEKPKKESKQTKKGSKKKED